MPTPVGRAETRSFKMHPKLLMDIIQRQAGSLAKAVLEGVMNSIDAGASWCRVHVRPKTVLIADDGQGITRREDIERYFETFGQPHEAEERKTYGVFRMGRGQLFAYGKNVWRTGSFKMTVDVKHRGFDYDLREGLEPCAGCAVGIELYDPLLSGDVAELERTVDKWCKYAQIPIRVNGKVVSIDPASEEWDHVTDEAYVRLRDTGSLSIYNLGVHCTDLGAYRHGSGGVIVSRRQLKVNFARNDVQSDCPVWKPIKALIEARTRSDMAKAKRLTDAQRQRLIDLVTQNELPPNAPKLKLFTTVNGRHYTASEIFSALWRHHHKVTVCKMGDPIGDRIMQSKAAFVITEECLTKFRLDLPGLVKLVYKLIGSIGNPPQVVDFATVAAGLHDRTELVKDGDLNAAEKLWIDLARLAAGELLESKCGDAYFTQRRSIVGGDSDAYDGWTDGATYIAIDRKFLARLTLDVRGLTNLGALILHEYCHGEPDTCTHTHDHEFYQAYHDRSQEGLGLFVHRAMANLSGRLKVVNRRLSKQALKNIDDAEKARRELARLRTPEASDG